MDLIQGLSNRENICIGGDLNGHVGKVRSKVLYLAPSSSYQISPRNV
jgi:hypothetical protein